MNYKIAIGSSLRETCDAAIRTLERLGYTYNGGSEWKPPIGEPAPINKEPHRLTVNELMDMEGLPVYLIDGMGIKTYGLVNPTDEYCIDEYSGIWEFCYYDMKGDGYYGLHHNGWIAYKYPPGGD